MMQWIAIPVTHSALLPQEAGNLCSLLIKNELNACNDYKPFLYYYHGEFWIKNSVYSFSAVSLYSEIKTHETCTCLDVVVVH